MKTRERPILFSAPMVRAILDGSKTQTRRIVKPLPVGACITMEDFREKPEYYAACGWCPYGKPGDLLWCKETFRQRTDGIEYRATPVPLKCPLNWKPSIFMPRWASRLTLEVKGVRVERLQQISDDDCAAEGCDDRRPLQDSEPAGQFIGQRHHLSAVHLRYEMLWESIHGTGSWELNPWVFVISFNKLTP